jgi:hypothetical protein
MSSQPLNLEIELITMFSIKCWDMANEEQLTRQFLAGIELSSWQESDNLQATFQDWDGKLDVPQEYLQAVELSREELEAREDVTYFQTHWTVQGTFDLEPSQLKTFAQEEFFLEFTALISDITLLGNTYNEGVVLKVLSVKEIE